MTKRVHRIINLHRPIRNDIGHIKTSVVNIEASISFADNMHNLRRTSDNSMVVFFDFLLNKRKVFILVTFPVLYIQINLWKEIEQIQQKELKKKGRREKSRCTVYFCIAQPILSLSIILMAMEQLVLGQHFGSRMMINDHLFDCLIRP